MKRVRLLTALLLVLTIFLCSCDNSSNSSQSQVGQSTSSGGNSLSDFSSNSNSNVNEEEKPGDTSNVLTELSDLEIINLMKGLDELDNSYSGTDLNEGFYKTVSRTDDTFLTYPVGYGEGTTGGRGAKLEDIYTCSTGLQFIDALATIKEKQLLDKTLKSTIVVNGTITQENSTSTELTSGGTLPTAVFQIIVDSINNLSVIGEGNLGVFDGVGLNFKSSNNVIVQNLTIHHPSKVLKNEKDCLEFNKCKFVWVDHNELFNDAPTNSSEKDFYDGLCDVKNESENVTISYNYLHDAFKTSLVGSGPDDLWNNRRISYHHNVFKNLNSRVPLIRSGYTHIYNNYYENVNTGINLRIGAQGFVENNVFVNVKNPICSIEETKGFWNAKGNVYDRCSGSGLNNQSSGSSFTPSYQYVLDDTANLKAFLDKTAGVGKIDLSVAVGQPVNYEKYEIPLDKIITREISELGQIKLDDSSLQKLLYVCDEISKDYALVNNVANVNELIIKIKQYCALKVSDVEKRINSVDISGNFIDNATVFFEASDEFDALPNELKNLFTANDKKSQLEDFYKQTFVEKFNSEIKLLENALSKDKGALEKFEKLSDRFENLDVETLNKAITSCNNHEKVDYFISLLNVLPSGKDLGYLQLNEVANLKNEYLALNDAQKLLLTSEQGDKYQSLVTAFEQMVSSSIKMDLSGVSTGRLTEFKVAGGFEIGVSSEVRDLSTAVEFGGESFSKCVFISGYGNAGSKCIKFTVYDDSDVVLVVANEKGNCRIKLTDPNKNEIDGIVSGDGVQQIVFKNVSAGEYRIFTDIPVAGGTFSGSSLFIYSASINPVK